MKKYYKIFLGIMLILISIVAMVDGCNDIREATEELNGIEDLSKIKKEVANLYGWDEKYASIYNNEVIKHIESGDKTGDYTNAISAVEKCESLLDTAVYECKKTNTEIIQKYNKEDFIVEYSNSQLEYFMAKSEYVISLKGFLKGNIEESEFIEKKAILEQKYLQLKKE